MYSVSCLSLNESEVSKPPLISVKAVAPINLMIFLSKTDRLLALYSNSLKGSDSLIPPPVLRNSGNIFEALFLVLHFN